MGVTVKEIGAMELPGADRESTRAQLSRTCSLYSAESKPAAFPACCT